MNDVEVRDAEIEHVSCPRAAGFRTSAHASNSLIGKNVRYPPRLRQAAPTGSCLAQLGSRYSVVEVEFAGE